MVDHENCSNIKSGDESKARVKVTFNSIQFRIPFSRFQFQASSDHPGEGAMESSELNEKTEGTAREAAPTGIPI